DPRARDRLLDPVDQGRPGRRRRRHRARDPYGAAPARHRGRPAGLARRRRHRRGGPARPRRRGVGGRPAARHGGAGRRWFAGPRRPALERHPLGRGRPGAGGGDGRPAGLRGCRGQRPGGLLHRHEAAVAPRPRAHERPAGRRGAPPPRPRLAPPRGARHGRVHRPRRRLRHGLLRHRPRGVAYRPRGERPGPPLRAAAPGRSRCGRRLHPDRGGARRRHRRQRRGRPRHGAPAGRRAGLGRHLRRGVRREHRPRRRRHRHRRRVRRRGRRLPPADRDDERSRHPRPPGEVP
ncbi:MAG: Xylulose kinase, partial [uncultured Nocardioides sp.]